MGSSLALLLGIFGLLGLLLLLLLSLRSYSLKFKKLIYIYYLFISDGLTHSLSQRTLNATLDVKSSPALPRFPLLSTLTSDKGEPPLAIPTLPHSHSPPHPPPHPESNPHRNDDVTAPSAAAGPAKKGSTDTAGPPHGGEVLKHNRTKVRRGERLVFSNESKIAGSAARSGVGDLNSFDSIDFLRETSKRECFKSEELKSFVCVSVCV
jgi:hypothetical protein